MFPREMAAITAGASGPFQGGIEEDRRGSTFLAGHLAAMVRPL